MEVEEQEVLKEKLFGFFQKINDFEKTNLHKHCIILYTKEFLYVYVPKISRIFEEKINNAIQKIVKSIDKILVKPKELKRQYSRFVKTSNSTKEFIPSLEKDIKKDEVLSSCYWYIIQFNIFSITDCLYTENFAISDETMFAFCDLLLKERYLSLTSPLDFSNITLNSRGFELLTLFDFREKIGSFQMPVAASGIIDPSIGVYDDEDVTVFGIVDNSNDPVAEDDDFVSD